MKFSFLVPVYNGQKYIKKCIDSLLNQNYDEGYDIIIVDDGSIDNTYKILKKLQKNNNNIKIYRKENGGISSTRNFLVSKCKTEYFIFVDSDDFVDPNLLKNISKSLVSPDIDVLKYQATIIDLEGNTLKSFDDEYFDLNGQNAFNHLVNKKNFFDVVWLYAFNRNFWIDNDFKFYDKLYHEDFGLIPYVILKAKRIISINYNGYYYVQTNNSIMRTNNDDKEILKAKHLLILFDYLKGAVYKLDLNQTTLKIFDSYIANALLLKANYVPKKYLNQYIIELKERRIWNLLLTDTIGRKIKRILVKFNLKLYINFQKKK